jgi:hypothetical protein
LGDGLKADRGAQRLALARFESAPPKTAAGQADVHSLSTGHRFGRRRIGDVNPPLIDSTDSPFCNFGSRYRKPACGRRIPTSQLGKASFDKGAERN